MSGDEASARDIRALTRQIRQTNKVLSERIDKMSQEVVDLEIKVVELTNALEEERKLRQDNEQKVVVPEFSDADKDRMLEQYLKKKREVEKANTLRVEAEKAHKLEIAREAVDEAETVLRLLLERRKEQTKKFKEDIAEAERDLAAADAVLDSLTDTGVKRKAHFASSKDILHSHNENGVAISVGGGEVDQDKQYGPSLTPSAACVEESDLSSFVQQIKKLTNSPPKRDVLGQFTKFASKVENFTGSSTKINLVDFLASVEQAMSLAKVEQDTDKLLCMTSRLSGAALDWFKRISFGTGQYLTYDGIREAILEQYVPQYNKYQVKLFLNEVKKGSQTVHQFLDMLRNTARAKGIFDENAIAEAFWNGLPPSMKTEILKTVNGKDIDGWDSQRMCNEAQKLEMAFAAFKPANTQTTVGGDKSLENVTCHKCKQKGHKANACPNRHKSNTSSSEKKLCSYCTDKGWHHKATTHNVDTCYSKQKEDEEQKKAGKNQPTSSASASVKKESGSKSQVVRVEYDQGSLRGVKTRKLEDAKKYIRHNSAKGLDKVGRFGLKAKVEGQEIEFTLDTGSDDMSCVNKNVFDSFPDPVKNCFVRGTDNKKFYSVEGSHVDVLGYVDTSIVCKTIEGVCETLNAISLPVRLYILDTLDVYGILGCDFILQHTRALQYTSGKGLMILDYGLTVPVNIYMQGLVNKSLYDNVVDTEKNNSVVVVSCVDIKCQADRVKEDNGDDVEIHSTKKPRGPVKSNKKGLHVNSSSQTSYSHNSNQLDSPFLRNGKVLFPITGSTRLLMSPSKFGDIKIDLPH